MSFLQERGQEAMPLPWQHRRLHLCVVLKVHYQCQVLATVYIASIFPEIFLIL